MIRVFERSLARAGLDVPHELLDRHMRRVEAALDPTFRQLLAARIEIGE